MIWFIFIILGACSWFGESAPTQSGLKSVRSKAETKVVVDEPQLKMPNILLLSLDTTRADHMQTYGYPRVTTPNLDELAAKSIVFERAYAPAPVTLPSHVSIFTGTAPTEHGVLTNVLRGGERFLPSEKLTSFAVYAQQSGYQTAGFISGAPLRARMGMGAGFDHWNEMPDREKERRAEDTVDAFAEWWETRSDKPFFAFIHFYDPHNPYRPPDDYPVRFDADKSIHGWARERGVSPKARMRHGTSALVNSLQATNGYDAELHYMDSQIARVFKMLEEGGLSDNTVIVVTADHGEGLGQHEAIGHGGLTWEEQLRVPLILYSPAHKARRIEELAWTPDIFPTVLGLAELPNEASWLKQVSGGDMLAGEGALPFAECIEGRRTLVGERFKYQTWSDGTELLHDLKSDPYELKDLSRSHLDQLKKFRGRYQKRQKNLLNRAIELDSGAKEMMPEEEVELLRQLGYLDDEHLPQR